MCHLVFVCHSACVDVFLNSKFLPSPEHFEFNSEIYKFGFQFQQIKVRTPLIRLGSIDTQVLILIQISTFSTLVLIFSPQSPSFSLFRKVLSFDFVGKWKSVISRGILEISSSMAASHLLRGTFTPSHSTCQSQAPAFIPNLYKKYPKNCACFPVYVLSLEKKTAKVGISSQPADPIPGGWDTKKRNKYI